MLGMSNGCVFAAQESGMFVTEWYIKSLEDKIGELHYRYGGHLKLSNKSTLEEIWDFCNSHFIVERNYLMDLATSYYFFLQNNANEKGVNYEREPECLLGCLPSGGGIK